MLTQSFSSEEKELIKEIMSIIIDSRARVIDVKHPLLIQCMEEFPEITEMDLAFSAVETIIACEEAGESPELCPALELIDLLSAQFVLFKMIPDDRHVSAKENVKRYFELLILSKKQSENLN